MNDPLLPGHSSPFEHALARGISRDLPVATAAVWNPERCPAALLPWLAWALSVDEWDSSWNEQVKRSVIAQSVAIHRKKGTVDALKRALAVLGLGIELNEWFEQRDDIDIDPTPFTFALTAWAGQGTQAQLTPGFYASLKRAVDTVKPVRAHYTFKVGARFNASLGAYGFFTAKALARR